MNESSWSRVLGVLVSPARAFQAIVERPSFLPPLLVLILTATAVGVVATSKIDYGEAMRATLEERGVDVPEADLDRGVALMQRFGWVFALFGTLVFQPAGFLLIALLYWIVFKILGSDMKFPTGLSVTLHSMLPFAIAAVASLPVAIGRESLTAEELQTGLLLSNLAFLAGEDAPAWIAAALRCIDFFGLWSLALVILGFRAATRLRAGTVTATAVACWIAWCLIKIGFVAVSSLFSGLSS
jgi:hypothetical protein